MISREGMPNRYNLLDEKFIPLKGGMICSLKEVFSEKDLPNLHCNPIQVIALTKFLLAIMQAAHTPVDDEAWAKLPEILPQKCLEYLEKWRDNFFLYGERPFLQIPQVRSAKPLSLTELLPEIATGNTTVILDSQRMRSLSDAEKALLVITLSGFAMGGKKADNSVVISSGYTFKTNDKGRASTGKPGALLGAYGYLHTFFLGGTLFESLWYNILTLKDIKDAHGVFHQGIGAPPWEAVPASENDGIAVNLKNSLMGSLMPMSKFYILNGEQIHFTDGIDYPNHKDGGFCTTTSVNRTKKDFKVLWADTKKLPWREITSMLSFLGKDKSYDNFTLRKGLGRILNNRDDFCIWSGGLKVSSNAGEQYASGSDDYIESAIWLDSSLLKSGGWFTSLEIEMKKLEELQKLVYSAIKGYYRNLGYPDSNSVNLAVNDFWERCELIFDNLLRACDDGTQKNIRDQYKKIAEDIYNRHCSRETARQLMAWASNRINYAKYLEEGEK
jgi:CRISPR system Cascade subunit CasA